MSVSRPVLIMNSVLAGLGVILGGAALGDFLSLQVVGLANLVLAGVALGWATYTQGQVTPNESVGAVKVGVAEDGTPKLVAGAASPVPDGRPVEVLAAGPSPY